MVTREQVEKYAELKAEEKRIKNDLKFLAVEIQAEMDKDELKEVATPLGKFELRDRRTYIYPAEITAMQEKVDVEIEKAVATGAASYTTTSSLYFLPNKDE